MKIDDLDSKNDKMGVDIPKEKRYLNTASYDYSVQFLVELMSENNLKIILAVPFQRNFIWKIDRASQLIESVILNVPIPPLYFSEEESGKWLVIDGLQRLNTLNGFFQNEFSLKGLDIIKELEGLKYKDLPPKAKDLLRDGLMRVNVIKKDSHEDIKYDIFMRLNKGSVTLNYQELRNCLYRGHLNDFSKKFVETNVDFLKMINLKRPHERYLDIEFIMRILALNEKLEKNSEGNYIIKDYTGRMVNFINDFMKRNSDKTADEAEGIINEFNKTILKVIEVFGVDLAFKDLTSKSLRFNKSIGEFICLSFFRFNFEILKDHKTLIRELLNNSLKENDSFRRSISQRTSDTDMVNYRINYWIKALENVIKF